MNAILDVMNGLKSNVVTVVFGEADSAAAILSSAGTKGKRQGVKKDRKPAVKADQPLTCKNIQSPQS